MSDNRVHGRWLTAPNLLVLGAVLLIGIVSARSTSGVRMALPPGIEAGVGVSSSVPRPAAARTSPITVTTTPTTLMTPTTTVAANPDPLPATAAPSALHESGAAVSVAAAGPRQPLPTAFRSGVANSRLPPSSATPATSEPSPNQGEPGDQPSDTVLSVSPDYPITVSPNVTHRTTSTTRDS